MDIYIVKPVDGFSKYMVCGDHLADSIEVEGEFIVKYDFTFTGNKDEVEEFHSKGCEYYAMALLWESEQSREMPYETGNE